METTRRKPVSLIAAVVGLALVAALISRTSEAAFTATTDNTGNTFTAGTVTLTDNDAGAALFTPANLSPGDTQTACIEVTYTGSITTVGAVKLYSGGYTDATGSLSTYLDVTVEEGTAGSTCAAFTTGSTILTATALATFDTNTNAGYASGLGAWTPTSTNEMRPYRFTVTLDAATPDTEQGSSTTGVTFVWEVQS